MQQQPPDLPPTGDQLGEDLYTSATADLSAGGVAMAREAAEEQENMPGGTLGRGSGSPSTTPSTTGTPSTPISDPTPAQIYAREDLVSHTERPTFVTDYAGVDAAEDSSRRLDPTWAIGAGGVVAVAGGIGGAWLYSRWQQERNRPINRLRRQALGMTGLLADVFGDVGDRLPDADDVRGSAPMSGGAAAALALGLVLARLLHVGGWGQSQTAPQTEDALRGASSWRRQLRELDVESARKKLPNVDVKSARNRMPKVDRQAARGPMGLGLGGMLGVAAAAYLAWRLLRGGGANSQSGSNWYYGDDRREETPNQ